MSEMAEAARRTVREIQEGLQEPAAVSYPTSEESLVWAAGDAERPPARGKAQDL